MCKRADGFVDSLACVCKTTRKIPVQVLPEVDVGDAEFTAISVLWPDAGGYKLFVYEIELIV